MPTVRIMLAPAIVMRDMYLCHRYDDSEKKLIKDNLDKYLTLPPVLVQIVGDGVDVADELFDLTNNPGRNSERQEKYGNGRSLSIGDIVKVGATMFACTSKGWLEIS